jgi:hypothetical protein
MAILAAIAILTVRRRELVAGFPGTTELDGVPSAAKFAAGILSFGLLSFASTGFVAVFCCMIGGSFGCIIIVVNIWLRSTFCVDEKPSKRVSGV